MLTTKSSIVKPDWSSVKLPNKDIAPLVTAPRPSATTSVNVPVMSEKPSIISSRGNESAMLPTVSRKGANTLPSKASPHSPSIPARPSTPFSNISLSGPSLIRSSRNKDSPLFVIASTKLSPSIRLEKIVVSPSFIADTPKPLASAKPCKVSSSKPIVLNTSPPTRVEITPLKSPDPAALIMFTDCW